MKETLEKCKKQCPEELWNWSSKNRRKQWREKRKEMKQKRKENNDYWKNFKAPEKKVETKEKEDTVEKASSKDIIIESK